LPGSKHYIQLGLQVNLHLFLLKKKVGMKRCTLNVYLDIALHKRFVFFFVIASVNHFIFKVGERIQTITYLVMLGPGFHSDSVLFLKQESIFNMIG
jgi:hypothetical protein